MTGAKSSTSGESGDPPGPAEAAAATSCADGRTDPVIPTRGLRIARAVLAPLLVLGAVGVHFGLNVPDEKVVMPKKDKSKKAGRRPKSRAAERTPAQMDAAWVRWKDERYDSETIKGKWGRRMQSTVNKAVVVARKEAFKGAPEDPRVVVSGTQCRTVRCSFILRSPYEHEPALVLEALKRQRYDGEPLWRMVKSTPTDPPNKHSPKKDHYVRVTIGVSLDVIDTREIEFEGGGKAGTEELSPTEPAGVGVSSRPTPASVRAQKPRSQ
ncbi:MAG: hypothetical protein KUG77_03025 [Nannocystaceae bacterium]|nr:hypothetical protein [Nannocystaceae bacterium]